MIGFEEIEKWAERAAVVAVGAVTFGSKLIRRLRRNQVLEPLHIGGNPQELKFAGRIDDIERRMKTSDTRLSGIETRLENRDDRDEQRWEQSQRHSDRVQTMLDWIVRKISERP